MISALLLMLHPGHAAPPPNPEWNCDEAMVQQEMNWCAGKDFEAADAALNAQWKITRDKMKARDESWQGSGGPEYDTRPGYFESLLEAQRAWLTYRKAHCALDGYNARGGSLEPLLRLTCKTALTKARTQELKEIAEYPE